MEDSNEYSTADESSYEPHADSEEEDFHMKTFLEMTEGFEKIRENIVFDGTANDVVVRRDGEPDSMIESAAATMILNTLRVTTHASVMYYGDRLALSTETVRLTMSESDHTMFRRVVKCFTNMIMGTYTNDDLQNLKRDHDELLKRWDACNDDDDSSSENDSRRAIGDEIQKMIKNMLDAPVYYTSSCMALISCGVMLRDLYRTTVGREAEDFDELMRFVRDRMRHNPVYPFECECPPSNGCCASYKTLLSLILEVPPIVHNQTYMLQVLAYLMYDKDGREEIFIINMKNIISPGLLDKIPTRLAMLVGSLDESVIRSTMKRLRKEYPLGLDGRGYVVANARTNTYNRSTLENIIAAAHDPRINGLINVLPGVENATVELIFDRCEDKPSCINIHNKGDVRVPKENNFGKNRCCGYLRLDPSATLVSSISLVQLCVYLYTDTRQASAESLRHYFIRDILLAMAKCSMDMDESCLEDMIGYLDRCDVFQGFTQNPLFTSTFYKLFQMYMKSIKKVADRYKTKGRKMNRLLEKMST